MENSLKYYCNQIIGNIKKHVIGQKQHKNKKNTYICRWIRNYTRTINRTAQNMIFSGPMEKTEIIS